MTRKSDGVFTDGLSISVVRDNGHQLDKITILLKYSEFYELTSGWPYFKRCNPFAKTHNIKKKSNILKMNEKITVNIYLI